MCLVLSIVDFQSPVGFIELCDLNIIQLSIFFCGLAFLMGIYAKNSSQNRFVSFIYLSYVSAILKNHCVEHAHYVRWAAVAAWNR